MYSLPQKLFAEFAGVFAIVFIASGAVCADQYIRPAAQGTAGSGWLGMAIAYGLAVAVMVTCCAHVSGGHLNPAVTAAFWVTRRLGTVQAVLYCAAQLLGGMAAAYLLTAIIPEPIWRPAGLGVTDLAPDFTRIPGMLLEGVITFFVVFIFFATFADSRSSFRNLGGLATGLAVTAATLVAGPFSGASMNPARTFGPALAARHWTNHGVYWVGPLFGGIIAGVLYDRIFLRDQLPS